MDRCYGHAPGRGGLSLPVIGYTPAAEAASLRRGPGGNNEKGQTMGVILLVLLLALIFAGIGFAVHLLWIVAVIVFVAWVIGWALAKGESAGGRRRWYGRF